MRLLVAALGTVRSLLFTLPLIYLCTIVLGLLAWMLSPLDPGAQCQHALARLWARIILAVSLVRVRVRGREKLEPGRPYVYVANHQSYMDIPILFACLPVGFRILAKASLFPIPFLGWYLRRTGNLPISFGRKGVYAEARQLLQAVRYLRQGQPLVVFPEGGRSVSGQLEEFRTGIFWAAVKAGAPLASLTIVGSRRVLPCGSWHIRPSRVQLIIDGPVSTEGLQRAQLDALVARVRRQIDQNLQGAQHD